MGDNISEDRDFLFELSKKGTSSPDDEARLDALLRRYDIIADDPFEIKFYRALVTINLVLRAAFEPNETSLNLEPVPDEDRPFTSRKASELVKEAIEFKEWEIVEEALRITKSEEKNLHPWALPALLDHGRSKTDLHPLFADTFGQRALWLASIQQDWQWWSHLQGDSFEALPPPMLKDWIRWQRMVGRAPFEAINKLSTRDRLGFLSEISKKPIDSDEIIGRTYLKSSTRKERRLALRILLQLDTAEYRLLSQTMLNLCQQYIVANNSVLSLQPNSAKIEMPFSTDDVPHELPKNEDIFQQLLTFLDPEQVFHHIDLSREVICQQLLTGEQLQPLCQIIVQSLRRAHAPANWRESMLSQWLETYPEDNSTLAPFEKVIRTLDYHTLQVVMAKLLNDTSEYFTTKLLIVVGNTDQYLNRDLSISLVKKIFNLLTTSLSRTEISELGEILQHLQYLLDPRINNAVASNWVEVDYRYQKLAHIMSEFRDVIKRRSILLTTIIEDIG